MGQPHQVEVVTRALDTFLDPKPPRRLEGEEGLARLRRIFDDRIPAAPPEEYLPNRIMVVWRLARAAALIYGICAEDEPLDAATEMSPSPWHFAVRPRLAPAQQQILRRASAGELIELAGFGLPLLPPEEDAEMARRWCAAMAILATDLNIERTQDGIEGLEGLLHPRTCGMAGVNERQVLALEELLIDEAQKLVVEVGERPAIEHFRTRYGFARKEAVGLIRLARADALQIGGSSVEEDRAIMVANLKDLIARAKEEMNTDKELKALKQLAAIQGLTRTEPEDRAGDFMKVIAAVAQRQDLAMLPPKPAQSALPGRRAVAEPAVAEYTVIDERKPEPAAYDEDAEALAEYDKENR